MSIDVVERFAIRIGKNQYSNGPKCVPVPLDRAKLWTNIGHVKNHLMSGDRAYKDDAEVVVVEIRCIESSKVGLVKDFVEEGEQRNRNRKAEAAAQEAKRRLTQATEDLKKAKETLKKLSR